MLRPFLILIATVTAGCAATATTPAPPPEAPEPAPTAAPTTAPTTTKTTCATSAILVNSCRPWSGGDIRSVDVVAGQTLQITNGDGYLLVNWRPAQKWTEAAQAPIDELAAGIRAIAPKKIFLSLHAQPEADVTATGGCDGGSGPAGTPADYRQMWKEVRGRFDKLGVTNVVWAMTYTNDPRWDCLVPELYPGDRYIDWIVFGGSDVGRFQRVLTGMNGRDRQVLTKPWGVYGTADRSLPNVHAYITAAG